MSALEIAGAVGALLAFFAGLALCVIAFARLALLLEAWGRARRARPEASGPETAVAQGPRASKLEYPPLDVLEQPSARRGGRR